MKSKPKPTFSAVRAKHHADPVALGKEAGAAVVNRMLRGEPVRRREAQQVLRALSSIAGQNYTLDDIVVPLLPELGGEC